MAGLVSVFLVHSLGSRLFSSQHWWKWFLYLTSWARLLSALHYVTEAVLVSLRWRREQGGWLFVMSECCHDMWVVCPSVRRPVAAALKLRQHRLAPPPVTPPALGRGQHQLRHGRPLLHRLLGVPLWPQPHPRCWQYLWPYSHIPGQHHRYFCVTEVKPFDSEPAYQISNTLNTRPWRVLHVYHVQLFCLVYVMSNLAYIEGGGTNLSDQPYIYSILDWNQPAV